MPDQSASWLGFMGDPSQGYGIVGFSNANPLFSDYGHSVGGVIQNAPDFRPIFDVHADYYIVGMQNSPFASPASKIATAHATTPANMPNLAQFIAGSFTVGYSDIRFNFGQANG